jgi:hypothetical protein
MESHVEVGSNRCLVSNAKLIERTQLDLGPQSNLGGSRVPEAVWARDPGVTEPVDFLDIVATSARPEGL